MKATVINLIHSMVAMYAQYGTVKYLYHHRKAACSYVPVCVTLASEGAGHHGENACEWDLREIAKVIKHMTSGDTLNHLWFI